ncbi:MAG: hypothetical protein GX648_07970 [Crenarchaeota archaeon]|jgi:hypothetical protein|nr:hypothetical protein [Thermoproteota archaeon]
MDKQNIPKFLKRLDVGNNGNTQTTGRKPRKKLYALMGSLIVIAVIVAAIVIPQGSGSPNELGLKYAVGEHMVYNITSISVAQQEGLLSLSGTPQTNNSTLSIDVLSFDGENYVLKQTMTTTLAGQSLTLPATINVSKTDYYKNLVNGAPDIFNNYTRDPTISAYLAQSSVKVDEVWTIPVNTGNASLGLTGSLILTFKGVEDIAVPAGTYKAFKIEISSSDLVVHADPDYLDAIHIATFDKATLSMSGTTYLEQGTCRLIKSDLIQEGMVQRGASIVSSSVKTEKILTEYVKN